MSNTLLGYGAPMVTRIHPEVTDIPEYDPFKDEKIVDLGPNDRMTVKQTLIVTNQLNLKSVVTICENEYGGVTQERILFMLEKMKSLILSGAIDESNGSDPEEAG